MLGYFKYLLTLIGSQIPSPALLQLQASLNYLKIGRWFREHQFIIPNRVATKQDVWRDIIKQTSSKKVLYLEFGVREGDSMKFWSQELKHPQAILHGFDSFEGLPEHGGPWFKGQFDVGGRIPNIDDPRIKFHKGWFDQVLPTYSIPSHETLCINLDADLYSSTYFVLNYLRPYIKEGTYIYFDEMQFVDHEPLAFDDFIRESGLQFKLFSLDITMTHCVFLCTGQSK